MYTNGTEDIGHRALQNRLNTSFPVGQPPESSGFYVKPPQEPEPPTTEELARPARSKRDRLLTDSDWTQMLDSPVRGDQAWLDYRQALRDITNQAGFPDTIEWPTSPVDEQPVDEQPVA